MIGVFDSGIGGLSVLSLLRRALPDADFLYYADTAVLEAQYASMKGWVDFMRRQDTKGEGLYKTFSLGDWLAQGKTVPHLAWRALKPVFTGAH